MVRVRTAMKNFSACNKHFGASKNTSRARRLADVVEKNDKTKSKCGPGGCDPKNCGPGGCLPSNAKGNKC
jgi:hypothetical protein